MKEAVMRVYHFHLAQLLMAKHPANSKNSSYMSILDKRYICMFEP